MFELIVKLCRYERVVSFVATACSVACFQPH